MDKTTKAKVQKSPIDRVNMALVIQRLFYSISDALVGVFLVVYVFQQTGSLLWTAGFIIGLSLCRQLYALLLRKFNYTHPLISISLKAVALAGSLVVTSLNITNPLILVICLSLTTALGTITYWQSVNFLFLCFSNKSSGKYVALSNGAQIVGALIATLVGGYLTEWFGMGVVYAISFIVYSCGLIPLIKNRKLFKQVIDRNFAIENKKLADLPTPKKRILNNFNAYHILNGLMTFAVNYIWPLFMSVNNLGYASIGIVTVLTKASNVLATFVNGKLYSKNKEYVPVIISAIILTLTISLMPLCTNIYAISAVSIITGLTCPFNENNMWSDYTKFSKNAYIIKDQLLVRKLCLNSGRLIGGIMLLLSPISFVPAYIVCGAATAGSIVTFNINKKLKQNKRNYTT